MPVTAPIGLQKIKTEFSGPNDFNNSLYTRGGGLIPNNSNNANIPTTTSGMAMSQFLNASKNYSVTATGAFGQEGATTTSFGPRSYVDVSGSISATRIGKNGSSLDQVQIAQLFDYYSGSNLNAYSFSRFSLMGDQRGTWWTTLTANSQSVTRAGVSNNTTVQEGIYSSFAGFTYWEWSPSTKDGFGTDPFYGFGFADGVNCTVEVIL